MKPLKVMLMNHDDRPLYALTIHQPYAHLIAIGEKLVENRTWRAPNFRGPLAIHAGLSKEYLVEAKHLKSHPDMAFGAVVAVAWNVVQVRLERLPEEYEWVAGDQHAFGPYCWVLEQVKPLEKPIPCQGRQKLWRLPREIDAEVAFAQGVPF